MTKLALSPGHHVQRILKERGWTNAALAEALGRTPQYVTDIIKGKKAMDVELALQLAQVLGGQPTPMQWMEWAIEHARSTRKLTRLEVIQSQPYARELIKLKWVDGRKSPEELQRELNDFWADTDRAENFRQSTTKRPQTDIARTAWSIEVYRRAMKQEMATEYRPTSFDALIDDLRKLMAQEEDVARVPDVLKRYGIRWVYLPNPEKCAVDGVASYNSGKPYIGMTLRIGRIDSFWFTLLHECMHIKHKDSETAKGASYIFADTIDRLVANPVEMRANDEARQAIIPDEIYEAFLEEYDLTLSAIEAFSRKHEIHKSLLLGRLKHDLHLDWSQFAREHPIVRHLLPRT